MNQLKVIPAILLIVFASCSTAQRKESIEHEDTASITKNNYYELHGKIQGLKADSILILKFKGGNVEASPVEVNNGEFFYSDSIEEPFFEQIYILKNSTNNTEDKLTEFLVSNGVIRIYGSSTNFDSIKVEGSEPDKIVKQYLAEDKELVNNWQILKISYDAFKRKGDKKNANRLVSQLNNINHKERIPLLKAYVKKYGNSMIGALLPNFCTLEDILAKEDYLEMYNFLTPEIQQTAYAKSILSKSH